MSLESFISERADVRQGFASRLPPPQLRFERGLLVPSSTENYELVGRAFGYLLRFRLLRLNPQARVLSAWRAEAGAACLATGPTVEKGADVTTVTPYPRGLRAAAYLADARRRCESYLQSGVVTDALLAASYRLAHFDLAAEAGPDRIDWRSINYLHKSDAADLRELLEVVDDETFRAARTCILDPQLPASGLVGGAHPDFIIDQCVFDVNATHDAKLDVRDLYRLVGYYLLLGLGGIFNENGKPEQIPVNSIGVYFARFGQLWKAPFRDIVHPQSMPELIQWFVDAACASNPEGRQVLAECRGPLAGDLRPSAG